MTAPIPRATSDLVAVGWLANVLGQSIAGTSLPSQIASWATTGFVTTANVGGVPHPYYALNRPVQSIDCWAAAVNSGKPPWGKAASLAAAVIDATYSWRGAVITLPGPAGLKVQVMSVWPMSEARRMPDDASGYAHYSLDLGMAWIGVS